MMTTTGALSRYQAGRIAAEYIASDPKRYSKWTGWHTAGINVAGSFLLGGIAASPTTTTGSIMNVKKVNSSPASTAPNGLLPANFHGLSPRAKLMMGVGYVATMENLVDMVVVMDMITNDMCAYLPHYCYPSLSWSTTVSVAGTFQETSMDNQNVSLCSETFFWCVHVSLNLRIMLPWTNNHHQTLPLPPQITNTKTALPPLVPFLWMWSPGYQKERLQKPCPILLPTTLVVFWQLELVWLWSRSSLDDDPIEAGQLGLLNVGY
jgi:hypothetical protein